MTKAIRAFFASLLFGTALLMAAQEPVRVQVPFDFHVSGQTLPAGTYTVRRVFQTDNVLLSIGPATGQAPVSFMVNLASPNEFGSSLLFRRYGDQYFLGGVKTAGGRFSVPRSKQERTTAASAPGDDVVVGSR